MERKSRPGPRTEHSDDHVIEAARETLASPLFHGEGYKKVRKRLLEYKGIRVGKERLLRLMRENDLLAKERPVPNGSSRVHDGEIITEAPDRMWACDFKEWRTLEGKLWMLTMLDHFDSGVIHHRTPDSPTMEPSMDLVRTSVKKRYGKVEKGICEGTGLYLRTDHASSFTGERFEKEVEFMGLEFSRAFVRSPECNGVIERFHETIKDQIGVRIESSGKEEARSIIDKFMADYNEHWLLHRLDLKSPNQYRQYYDRQHR